ncbi:uncharacterized serine/threonine-protein kinase SBK3 [Suricata suricatta]|uniref:uncharacterized serine/threonine-protein kinase SBK3 n=1 Tax=Suricata suricatta TaxID=37032 RepID=UPI001155A977|nr:uncharacterized serine/threonine-protein kinase SBK3 [Suricata suricatta]
MGRCKAPRIIGEPVRGPGRARALHQRPLSPSSQETREEQLRSPLGPPRAHIRLSPVRLRSAGDAALHALWGEAPPKLRGDAENGPNNSRHPGVFGHIGEDTSSALQRLVELTATRVTPLRNLRVRYRLIRELGSGSYGRVLLARPRQGGPAVALKLLRRDLVPRTTFLREFCVGRCVSSHPGLLQTLAGPLQTPRHFAFAQEYAPHGDLSGMLQERGLPELLVKRVAAQLAGALDFLHGRGLVHADVKPDNVLVFDPVCSRVALGDLGLTRPEGSPSPAPPGPLPSAPPELCLLLPPDTLPLRPAVDSWGLGVLLFCAATACFPWAVALAPDPEFEAFAGWVTTRPQPPRPPPPWDQFASPALTLLQGLLDLDPETRSPPLAVLDFLGDDWGQTWGLGRVRCQPGGRWGTRLEVRSTKLCRKSVIPK